MRLQNIYYICKENQRFLRVENETVKQNNITFYRVNNWDSLKKTLLELRKITMFSSSIDSIFQITDMLYLPTNKLVLDSSQNGSLSTKIKEIAIKVTSVIDLCESMGYNYESEYGFDVKLPEESELVDFFQNIERLNIALGQNPFLTKDMHIKMKKVDVGSTWLEFIVDGANPLVQLGIVAFVIEKAIKLWSYIITCKKQEEEFKKAEIDTGMLNTLAEAQKKLIEAHTKSIIVEMEEKAGTKLTKEDKERAALSLDAFIRCFDKGMEFHNSLKTEEKPEVLFPTSDIWKSIAQGSLKLLEEKEEDTEKE